MPGGLFNAAHVDAAVEDAVGAILHLQMEGAMKDSSWQMPAL